MTVPLKDYEYTDYRWVDGFEFLITVEAADADSYALGDILIPRQEENPFAGYLNNLLELIQVNPAYYQIHTVEWTGEPWVAEDGVTYRQAIARGLKQVATVNATYEALFYLIRYWPMPLKQCMKKICPRWKRSQRSRLKQLRLRWPKKLMGFHSGVVRQTIKTSHNCYGYMHCIDYPDMPGCHYFASIISKETKEGG